VPDSNEMLEELNPEQRRAVTAGDGPLLVLAGAGSGKTRVLTTRIAHLIRERGVPPRRILAFTFTNKAAREMRSRVERLLGGVAADCWLGTFHATGVRILRREAARLGWDRDFAIYDTDDTEALLRELLGSRTLPRHLSPAEARQRLSAWKNERVTPERARALAGDPIERVVADLFADYEQALRRNNAFDFDDLIARPVDLFEAEPEALRPYSERFLHVLVDEFQDTNAIQMVFIEQLSGHHGNLLVVGDDDQSIYGWRGARIRNILEFEKRFPATNVVRLEENYRSTAPILEAANQLIAHNRGRMGKNLWTARQGGERIRAAMSADEEEEALRVARLAQEWVEKGGSRNDIAVLYRTNAQSRALEDALRRHNIPYQIVGGTRFYERREVRDVLAYLKVVQNPADSVALLRTLNVPRRGIGDTTVGRLQAAAAARGWSLSEAVEHCQEIEDMGRPAARRLAEFARFLAQLRGLAAGATCAGVVQAVIETTDYLAYLRQTDEATFETRRENVEELVSAARAFAEESDDASLRAFLEEIALLTDIDGMRQDIEVVTLMTLHSAKGLEFPVIAITGIEEGLLPHASSLQSQVDVEEERRLFYVGLTRARDHLYLFTASNRRRYGDYEPMMQSRFLAELPESCLEAETVRAPSWRSYAEGDPDTYWRQQGQGAQVPRRGVRDEDGTRESAATYEDDFSQEHVALAVGMRVRHEKYGVGRVERLEGHGDMMKVTVHFERHDAKKFVARYAKLLPVR